MWSNCEISEMGTQSPFFLPRTCYFPSSNALMKELLHFKPQKQGKLAFKRRHDLLQASTCLLLRLFQSMFYLHLQTPIVLKTMVSIRSFWALLSMVFKPSITAQCTANLQTLFFRSILLGLSTFQPVKNEY